MGYSRRLGIIAALLLVAATATAQVNFSWDAGSSRAGYRSPDRMLMELGVVPLAFMGESIPLYLEFSPLQVAGSPSDQSGQFHLDMESLTFLNLTAGYALVFGRHLLLAPRFQLNYLDPRDITRFHPKPQLQQRLISLSAGVNLSNQDAFTPHAHVTAGVNILALENFFPETER